MIFMSERPYLCDVRKFAKRRKVRVYLVGGFVRDLFLKRECMDFDFAVEKNAIAFAKAFAKSIRGAFILLDAEHGCARVAKKEKGRVLTYDFADFRGKTLKDDLKRRDFTINTLSIDISSLEDGDCLEKGMADAVRAKRDLKDGLLRMASKQAFVEDPLRILRAFSLQAQLGFRIEKETLKQIKTDRDRIAGVSAERLRDELFKILESDRAGTILRAMDRLGILDRVIPQVRLMFGVEQGTYHHLDVWPHALETVKQCDQVIRMFRSDERISGYLKEKIAANHSRAALLRFSCLLHDIGKPDTRRKEGDRICFHGHEHVGRQISDQVAKDLKLSTRERLAVGTMVRWHLRPGYLSNFKRPSERAFFRYFRDTADEAVGIALLSLADQQSTCGPMTTEDDQRHHKDICLEIIDRFFLEKDKKPFVPLINGHDLINSLKLKPSPLFSEILSKVEEEQGLGRLTTPEGALAYAAKLAAQLGKKKPS